MNQQINKTPPKGSQQATKRIRTAARQSEDFYTLLLNEEIVNAHHDGYTHIIPSGEVTDQSFTGCCWIYAGLNMLRTDFIQRSGFSLSERERLRKMVEDSFSPSEFEFSYAYLYFFEKLEKSNRYFEEVIRRLMSNKSEYNLREHLDPMRVVDDGGWFGDFSGLVGKYGLVPYEQMPDTASSIDSGVLIDEIADRVALGVYQMKQEVSKWKQTSKSFRSSKAALRQKLRKEIKVEYLEDVIEILKTHLGTPPGSFEIRRWSERQDVYPQAEEGQYQPSLQQREYQTETYTPHQFAQEVVGFDEQEYVTISYNALKARDRTYLIQPSSASNSTPVFPERILNIERSRLHQLIVKAVTKGYSVWFAADAGQAMHMDTGIMHPDIFERDGIYHFPRTRRRLELPERESLKLFRRSPNHAMVIRAVDIDEQGKVVKYGVENSWGDETGDGGMFHMYKEWFDQFGFEIIVPRKLLSSREQSLWKSEPTRVPKDDWYY